MNDIAAAPRIEAEFVAAANARLSAALEDEYGALGRTLSRRGIDIETITNAVSRFVVAAPSWAVGTGGTRFARFPGSGEPHNVFEKMDDCAVVNRLTAATPVVSLHFPWDATSDYKELREYAGSIGLSFGPVNSNTFQDSPGQKLSYKFGSLSHTDAAVRAQAVAHNLDCIRIGGILGARALSIWIGDGANFPGQQHIARAFDRYIESCRQIYAGLPDDWRLFTTTVIQDWGSSLLAAQALGPKAFCLVDLGHHAPTTNIEMIVTRLIAVGKLGGFHFNDSKYGDDDLDSGSIDPYRLFLVFNELVDAEWRKVPGFAPAHMLDQSHNVTDPIESLLASTIELQRAYAQALLVDRAALAGFQEANDALMATQTLKHAFTTDVQPILAMARRRKGGAVDPIACYRTSGYRQAVTARRPASRAGGGGIV